MKRTSGILLHPTSLPGRYGIGDLGDHALRFIDFLAAAGQGLWQMLPLNPTGYGDSPYQTLSAFAGNPLLLSLDNLLADGWLRAEDLQSLPIFPEEQVDFGAVIPWKLGLLAKAHERFRANASNEQRAELDSFRHANAAWLNDYVLFNALKKQHNGAPWHTWEKALVVRDPATLEHWRSVLSDAIDLQAFQQFYFSRQWAALRGYAHHRHVHLIGDIPIFVAHDSADVWAHQEWFQLDTGGNPTAVAGVPPDYFSATGQLWGNPLYRWDALAKDGYRFWVDRVHHLLALVDWIRLDHFRGFAAYWEVPAGSPTAANGRWVPGPGLDLFATMRKALGGLPLLAEDLGEITPDVYELLDQLGFPRMAILQFAFSTDEKAKESKFLPHNHIRNQIVYTGTHDNDTTLGWWHQANAAEKKYVRRYLNMKSDDEMPWDFIRAGWGSVARMAVVPMQDLLALGTEARFNMPGRLGGNWTWRLREQQLSSSLAKRLRDLSDLYERKPEFP